MPEAHEPATGPGNITTDAGIQALKTPDTAIQTEPTTTSPPATPALADVSLQKPQARLAPLDVVLGALLLLLTFFLGSFAIFNADIWTHLATGRLVATGQYQFGVDPFAYTTADVLWVNQSWLFDWLIYVIHGLAGGEGLVVCKALLLVGLALVLLAMRRPEQGLWLPVIFVGLSMLTLSTRAFLQPFVVSFFFLGLTLYWLTKARTADSSTRHLWLLPLLFALWVNMDAWFILGPITVFLFWLGALVDGWIGRSGPVKPALLGKVFLLSLAGCMVNPHHFRAFTLPTELAAEIVSVTNIFPSWMVAGGTTVQQIREVDPQFMNLISPLSRQFITETGQGLNVAGVAYFVLLLLGLGSFLMPMAQGRRDSYRLLMLLALAAVSLLFAFLFRMYFVLFWLVLPLAGCARGISYSRYLVWLFFALLSLLQARLIPFFAVAGGAIALLNFQDFFAQVAWTRPLRTGRVRLFAGLATSLAFLVLLFLAWPGWLNGPIGDFQPDRTPHRVAWSLHIDPSLYLTAYRLSELKEEGKIRQGFSLHPDLGCYCAWFAPEVKGFLDYRYALFPKVAQRYARVRKSLWQEAQETLSGKSAFPNPDFADWRKLAADYDVNHLIVTNFDRMTPVRRLLVMRLWLDKRNWPVLYEDGRALVFGWANERPLGFCIIEGPASHNRQAFTQVAAEEQPAALGNDFPAADRGWWRRYLQGTDVLPLASSKAHLDHFRHQFWSQRWQYFYLHALQVTFATTPAAFRVAGAGGIWLPAAAGSLVRLPLLRAQDSGPPADLVLMMRHARLGVNVADHNPNAYLILSDACKALWKTQEDHWSLERGQGGAPLRTKLRQTQTIAALKTSLVLFPEDHRVHEALGEMYLQMHFLDVALEHYSQALRHVDRFRPKADNVAVRQSFDNYKKNLEGITRALADEVKHRRADFDLRTTGADHPLIKFEWALGRPYKPLDPRPNRGAFRWYDEHGVDPLGFGLANRALAELQQAKVEQLDKVQRFQVSNHQLDLLLTFGRLKEVQEALDDLQPVIGPYYLQYLLLSSAAAGNYEGADLALAEQIRTLDLEKRLANLASSFCQNLAPVLSGHELMLRNLALLQNQLTARVVLRQAAELYLLRGLLALEKGDVDKATGFFQKTLALVGDTVYFADRPIAQRYLELIRKR